MSRLNCQFTRYHNSPQVTDQRGSRHTGLHSKSTTLTNTNENGCSPWDDVLRMRKAGRLIHSSDPGRRKPVTSKAQRKRKAQRERETRAAAATTTTQGNHQPSRTEHYQQAGEAIGYDQPAYILSKHKDEALPGSCQQQQQQQQQRKQQPH